MSHNHACICAIAADEKSRRGRLGDDHETKVKRGRKEDGRAVELQQNAPMVTVRYFPFSDNKAKA